MNDDKSELKWPPQIVALAESFAESFRKIGTTMQDVENFNKHMISDPKMRLLIEDLLIITKTKD
jgi:hypothetical protein